LHGILRANVKGDMAWLMFVVILAAERVPVTLETEIRVPTLSPDSIRLVTEVYRADGSHAVVTRPGQGIDSGWEIMDATARTMSFAFSQIEAATTQPVRRSVAARWAIVHERCEDAHAVPSMTIRCEPTSESAFGHRLTRVTLESETGGPWMRREMLVVPSLNFVPLEERSWLRGKLTREKRTTALKVGDPDPALFRVPSHFQMFEKVSDLMRLFQVRMRLPINDAQLKMLDVKWEKERAAVLRGE
jgi:hypothetical protein